MSSIEWTDVTWNPVTGCSKVSEGCRNCYAERMALRLQKMGQPRYTNGFQVTIHPESLNQPLKWSKPRMVFVNSMSDLFHEKVSFEFITKVFDVMNNTPKHTYQILTKRPERVADVASSLKWTPNIWIGTSVENEKVSDRINDLRQVPAHIRFLSCEPLLGPLQDINLQGIHWVIVGGESGPGSRPMSDDWVRSIRDQCQEHQVAFFFKQWGGVQKHRTGRLLDGRTYDEFPIHFQD